MLDKEVQVKLFDLQFNRPANAKELAYASRIAHECADLMRDSGVDYTRARQIVLARSTMTEFRTAMYCIQDALRGPLSVIGLRAAAKRMEARKGVTTVINLEELGL